MATRKIVLPGGTVMKQPIETARHATAFETWYRHDRSFQKAAQEVGQADYVLRSWAKQFHWHHRADERDLEVERIAARKAIRRRADMLDRHRKAGELMVARATQFFRNNDSHTTPIERAADAINAMSKGIEIERTAESLPSWIFDLLEADDATLATIVRQAAADQESGDSGDLRADHPDAHAGELLDGRGELVTDDVEWEDYGVDEEGVRNGDASERRDGETDAV